MKWAAIFVKEGAWTICVSDKPIASEAAIDVNSQSTKLGFPPSGLWIIKGDDPSYDAAFVDRAITNLK